MKIKQILRQILCVALCLLLTVAAFPLPLNAAGEDLAEEFSKQIRSAMTRRSEVVVATYRSPEWLLPEEAKIDQTGDEASQEAAKAAFDAAADQLLQDVYSRAIAHTGIGNEGDYLRWQIASYSEEISYPQYLTEGDYQGNYEYSVTFNFSYYTTEEQENELTAKLQTVLAELELDGKTDYQKIKVIYDYICANVAYDFENLNDEEYDLKYSAYAALVNGKAVCQGYSNLFYRMALDAGLNARLITGTSRGQGHAWNIVKLDGVWYNLDCTWDSGTTDYRFFLKCDANMPDHLPDAEYTQPEFLAAHSMANADYVIPEDPIPSTEPATQPTTEPATQPTTAPATQPSTAPATQPSTAPATQPTTEPATQPTTEPATRPTTEPATRPTTEPATRPTTAPATQPSTAPATQPTTVPATQPSSVGTTQTQNPGTEPSSGDGEPDDAPSAWILVLGGVVLLAAAAGGAVVLVRKRRS